MQDSVLEFFPSVTQNSCIMLIKDIKLVEECLNINTHDKHLKRAFNVPNEFLIVIRALDHL